MPERLLPDWIDGFMEYTDNTEPPDSYRVWTAISTIAGILQRKCYLVYGMETIYPNMYICLVGPPGRCRKGTAMRPGYRFLIDLGIKLAAESITREALVRELQECEEAVIMEDGSMKMHSSLTIVSQELAVFLGYKQETLMADLTDWYDCAENWVYRTKNKGTDTIKNLYVNLLGATTPISLQESMPMVAIGGGLASRILFIYEEKKGKVVPYSGLSNEQKKIKKKLDIDIQRIYAMQGQFKYSTDWFEAYVDWYSISERQIELGNPVISDPRFGGYVERRATHLRKLCIILAASRGNCNYTIELEDFQRALTMLTNIETNMPHTFSGIGRSDISELQREVSADIITAGRVTFAELMETHHYNADNQTMWRVLEVLKARKFCEQSDVGNNIFFKYIPLVKEISDGRSEADVQASTERLNPKRD